MDSASQTDANELQEAISNITAGVDSDSSSSSSPADSNAVDAVAASISDSTPSSTGTTPLADASAPIGAPTNTADIPPVMSSSTPMTSYSPTPQSSNELYSGPKGSYGDPDLGAVKTKALTDLRPLVEKLDLSPESKFKIYKEIIEFTHDKSLIEPAYEVAAGIAEEKLKAESLLYIVEMIDKLGTGAP